MAAEFCDICKKTIKELERHLSIGTAYVCWKCVERIVITYNDVQKLEVEDSD